MNNAQKHFKNILVHNEAVLLILENNREDYPKMFSELARFCKYTFEILEDSQYIFTDEELAIIAEAENAFSKIAMRVYSKNTPFKMDNLFTTAWWYILQAANLLAKKDKEEE